METQDDTKNTNQKLTKLTGTRGPGGGRTDPIHDSREGPGTGRQSVPRDRRGGRTEGRDKDRETKGREGRGRVRDPYGVVSLMSTTSTRRPFHWFEVAW